MILLLSLAPIRVGRALMILQVDQSLKWSGASERNIDAPPNVNKNLQRENTDATVPAFGVLRHFGDIEC